MKCTNLISRVVFLILVIFVNQRVISQENYLPGYILSLKDDTVKGYVDYRNWKVNPKEIYFKTTFDAQIIGYSPTTIRGFGVKDEVYKSAIVDVEMSQFVTYSLDNNPDLNIVTDTTFLQTMIQGDKGLYYYFTPKGKEQFYYKDGSAYELLVYKRYFLFQKGNEGVKVVAENNKFIGQLIILFQDCDVIKSKLKGVKYDKKSLEKLFSSYYTCTNQSINFKKSTEKTSLEMGVIAGLSFTNLQFNGESPAYLTYPSYDRSVNFTTGLFFDVILPRNQQKLSVCNELIYSSYSVSGKYEEYYNENKYFEYYTILGFSYLKMKNMFRYKYPVGKFHIYVNAGPSYGFAFAMTNYLRKESTFYDTFLVTEDEALQDIRIFELGYDIGAGLKFKKYSCEIRYVKGNGIEDYNNLRSATYSYFLYFGYRF